MIDIKAIRARADAATPGPWRAADIGRQDELHDHVVARGCAIEIQPIVDGHLADEHHDCAFIAAARTDVPALCSRVEALEAALRTAKLALGPAIGTHGERCDDSSCDVKREGYAALEAIIVALEGGES